MSIAIFLFASAAELTYRGLCYGSSLLVKLVQQCLRVSVGWLSSIVQAQRRPSEQQRAYALNREDTRAHQKSNQPSYPPADWEGATREREGKLKTWSLVWNKTWSLVWQKKKSISVDIPVWWLMSSLSWQLLANSCCLCIPDMCIRITSPWSQQNKLTEGLSIWSWSHQL